MNVLLALLIMFMAFTVGLIAVAIVITIMGLAGAPGALLFEAGQKAQNVILRVAGLAVAALGQSFVVGAYAVLVVGLLHWFSAGRLDVPTWPLWIAAFFHSGAAPTYAMKERPEEPTAQHQTLGIVALAASLIFFLSAFWPTSLRGVYGWVPLFDHVASSVQSSSISRDTPLDTPRIKAGRDECREAIMFFIRAHSMMSDDVGNVVQLSASQEREMRSLLRHGLEKANEVPGAFFDAVHPYLRSEFRDHLAAGWQFYLDGLEQRDPNRQIRGIRLIQRWENFKQQNADLLWEAIIER